MGQRDEQQARTRARILEAARALFGDHGFAEVGMRAIAQLAGVSTGAMFHNWVCKEALFEEAIGRPWPDPEAFAQFVRGCSTLEEARAGAAIFLTDVAGNTLTAIPWRSNALR